MNDRNKDAVDHFIDFILADDSPVGPEDEANIQMFNNAVEKAKIRVAKARLERARAGAYSNSMSAGVSNLDRERAKRIYDRAKAGDTSDGLTLAARFGDGSMDGDLNAILEDIAELEDDENEKD